MTSIARTRCVSCWRPRTRQRHELAAPEELVPLAPSLPTLAPPVKLVPLAPSPPTLTQPAEHVTPAPLPPTLAFEVVFARVVVRAQPSTSAEALATKLQGQVVIAEAEEHGWAQLSERFSGRLGWMLIDGAVLGLGSLLRPVVAPAVRLPHALRVSAGCIELRTGQQMPLLGMGTGGVPGLEGEEAARLVAHALRACGVRLIDTASGYHNEEAVGEGIRRSGVPREELFIVTKVAPHDQGYEAAIASVRRSLRRMRLEYLDLVLIHWPGGWQPQQREWPAERWLAEGPKLARQLRDGSWHAFEALHAEGVVKACGVSNYTPGHLLELLQQVMWQSCNSRVTAV